MKTLVIVAHPHLNNSRVNKRWAEKLRDFSDLVTVHDLYAAYPDGSIDVAQEQALLLEHERIVFQFPSARQRYLKPFRFHGTNAATDEQIEASAEQYVKHILNPELNTRKHKV
ncbi:NAD(P)H-dependent oxidoreductase [Laceyella putida]|uniref:NAD(P)H-dependent oxidoreductase n=1 Tax=Laceyella putida TaxID=110101 RepID=A0ABW2RL63_9BACL